MARVISSTTSSLSSESVRFCRLPGLSGGGRDCEGMELSIESFLGSFARLDARPPVMLSAEAKRFIFEFDDDIAMVSQSGLKLSQIFMLV
jgi:hypothetical protein